MPASRLINNESSAMLDHHPLGVLPSLSEMEEITALMRRAGAAILDEFTGSLCQEQLAAAVYIVMEKQRLEVAAN